MGGGGVRKAVRTLLEDKHIQLSLQNNIFSLCMCGTERT